MTFGRVFSAMHPLLRKASSASAGLLITWVVLGTGCSELQARKHARAGNVAFLNGDYATAVREYDLADTLHPSIEVVTLNRGIACRQLMAPGGKSPEHERAVDCALATFKRLSEMRPGDARGEQLYVQTLFDADRFGTLVKMYEDQLQGKPDDLAAINGLVSVYSRAGDWPNALRWSMKRADVDQKDAEAQYAVGEMIYRRLYQKGGADKDNYDPWPEPSDDPKDKAQQLKVPPPFAVDDIRDDQRARLAERAISYLSRALERRPNYRDAMSYMGLVYRQKSYAFLEEPEKWQECKNSAEEWYARAKAQSLTN